MSLDSANNAQIKVSPQDVSDQENVENITDTTTSSGIELDRLNDGDMEKDNISTSSSSQSMSSTEQPEACDKMTFNFSYFGEQSLDRRFTHPMLPWIMAEVRRFGQTRNIVVQVSTKNILCIDEGSGAILFEHRLQGISRISRCQRDKTCFTYLFRVNSDADFTCHVFKAADSDTVHKFAHAIKEATRELLKLDQHAKDHGKLPVTEVLIDGTSSNYEVMYCGKAVVSHKKAPPSLIDDTIQKFREYEQEKKKRKELEKVEREISESENCCADDSRDRTNSVDTEPEGNDDNNETDKIVEKENKESNSETKSCRRGIHCTESEKNRTILFHISKIDISLISLDKKSFMLTKRFKEISFCSQGIKHTAYFGFICREKTCNSNYMCYVFKCHSGAMVDEIMLTLRQAFHSALQTSHVVCETCPMHQLHKLCLELESLTPSKIHSILSKRLENLNENQYAEITARLKESNERSDEEENEMVVSFLRSICEAKQKSHAHISDNNLRESPRNIVSADEPKPMSKFDSFKNKAKKSLTSSFENLLGRNKNDANGGGAHVWNSGFRSRSNTIDQDEGVSKMGMELPLSADDVSQSAPPTPARLLKKNSKDWSRSPIDSDDSMSLPSPRKRSSTIGDIPISPTSPGSPRYFDFKNPPQENAEKYGGSPAARILRRQMAEYPHDEYSPKRRGSWRQAIFNRVVTPMHHEPKVNSIRENDHEIDCLASPPSVTNTVYELKPVKVRSRFKSKAAIRALWKKAILEQILLLRMEKENKSLQEVKKEVINDANQDAVSTKRKKLDYEEITPCLREITSVWDDMIQSAETTNTKYDYEKLLQCVKQGVPRIKRGEIWVFLIQQHAASNSAVFNPPVNRYDDLLKQLTSHQHAILIDLGRTFPTHPYFATQLGPGQLSLFNLLKAYSLLDSEVGYCQGLSFVAGILLMHMKEEEAFEMLKYMMFQLGIRRQYKPDMVALQLQMYQLSRLLHDYYRPLHDHLEMHDIAPSLYAAPWFLTLFASQFPLGFVARVFDLLFLQGMDVVIKVSLIILGSHSELILQCSSFESIVDFLKNTLPSLGIIQMERTINQVFELDISRQLHAYEVEYHVLQEEMINTPHKGDVDLVEKLETNNRVLKHQKMEILEQLQKAHGTVHSMEASIGNMQATVNKYKSQVRALELERTALLTTVARLRKLIPEDKLEEAGVTASLSEFTLGDDVKDTNPVMKMDSFDEDLDSEVACITRVNELRTRGRHMSGDSVVSTCSSEQSLSSASDFKVSSPALPTLL